MDALVPRPAGLPSSTPAPLLPGPIVAGLRGAAGLPDLDPPTLAVIDEGTVAAAAAAALDDEPGPASADHDVAVEPTVVAPDDDGGLVLDASRPADGSQDGPADAAVFAVGVKPDGADGADRVAGSDALAHADGAGAGSGSAGSASAGSVSAGSASAGSASAGSASAGSPSSAGARGSVAPSAAAASLAGLAARPAPSSTTTPADAGVVGSRDGVVVDGAVVAVVAAGDVGSVDAGVAASAVLAAAATDAGVVAPTSSPRASPPPPRAPSSVPGFEFPDDTTTWRAFLDKVHAVQSGARAKARVVQLGDSEIAGDRFVSTLRTDMAARIGLGGPGFALASPPWHWYRRAGFDVLESQGFKGRSFIFGKGTEGNYGPGGVAFDAVDAGARVDARLAAGTAGAGCTIELLHASQPGGGAIEVFVDDVSAGVVELAGDDAVASWRHEASACPRRLSARVRRLPARVFGWSVESTRSGIVWTSLGTVGANASALSRYAQGRLGQALALLQPDLVVATYGLNLTGHGAPVPRAEGEQLQRAMAEIRALRPDTACLVMSPYPVLVATDGALAPSSTTRRLASVQRRAAQAAGCVFLDREKLVGGPDVALEWLNRKPRYLSGDYVHLTPEGASYVSRTVSRLLIGEIFGG